MPAPPPSDSYRASRSPEPELDIRRPLNHDLSAAPAHNRFLGITDDTLTVTDRTELIARLKKGESPTWVPNRTLEDYYQNNSDHPRQRSPDARTKTSAAATTPAEDFSEPLTRTATVIDLRQYDDRPPSALHSGDFTQTHRQSVHVSSPTTRISWLQSSPTDHDHFFELPRPPRPLTGSASRRTSVSSFSSSFVLREPTSPLIQSATAESDGSPATDPIYIGEGLNRRHTEPAQMIPHSLDHSMVSASPDDHSYSSFAERSGWKTRTQRANSTHGVLPPLPPSSLMSATSRRPSMSDQSPLQKAAMVGSYEESILRGRMSTVPSKPLGFVAQIGVLGLGNCKPSLKCPKHVSVPFPAVFYSYPGGTTRSAVAEDGPSPYVGLVDLENNLKQAGVSPRSVEDGDDSHEPTRPASRNCSSMKTSREARAPPGGSYRIPQKGQLQIVIKNPNKTAVKLFLVPYDLKEMKPGTKTFIRQKSYSAGPIIAGIPDSGAANDRQTLRYLIHLHICCPSRGRYFLYKSIRIVFANRVPDGKESLRNEISLPEPRYSAYKPQREHPSAATSSSLAMDKALRRRSTGFALGSTTGSPFQPMPLAHSKSDSIVSTSVPQHSGSGFASMGLGISSPGQRTARRMSLMRLNPTAITESLREAALLHSQDSDYMEVEMDDILPAAGGGRASAVTAGLAPAPSFLQNDRSSYLPMYALSAHATPSKAAGFVSSHTSQRSVENSSSDRVQPFLRQATPPVFGTVSPLISNRMLPATDQLPVSTFSRLDSPARELVPHGLLSRSLRGITPTDSARENSSPPS